MSVVVELKYELNTKRNGKNWFLTIKKGCKSKNYKLVTKPKGKVLRWYIKSGIEDVDFSIYWDAI